MLHKLCTNRYAYRFLHGQKSTTYSFFTMIYSFTVRPYAHAKMKKKINKHTWAVISNNTFLWVSLSNILSKMVIKILELNWIEFQIHTFKTVLNLSTMDACAIIFRILFFIQMLFQYRKKKYILWYIVNLFRCLYTRLRCILLHLINKLDSHGSIDSIDMRMWMNWMSHFGKVASIPKMFGSLTTYNQLDVYFK